MAPSTPYGSSNGMSGMNQTNALTCATDGGTHVQPTSEYHSLSIFLLWIDKLLFNGYAAEIFVDVCVNVIVDDGCEREGRK